MVTNDQWPGDALERKPYADFLTNYLVSKVSGENGNERKSFTLALDAQWGHGKTFFVTNWSKDLRKATTAYPTLVFDAWTADYANDPMVAFMAAFKATLDEKICAAGLGNKIRKRAAEHVASAVTGLRRAILPAGKQIAKGLLQKATGVAADEVFEAFKTGSDSTPHQRDAKEEESVAKASLDAVNRGLDEFFSKAMEEQGERNQAVNEFRTSIEATLKVLESNNVIALPMFVFIDELDRCRPSFAISLLEGIKHLFGIPGVCFVVSTNLAQLSESVKAVYGSGFDGYGYLKRFFDVEYSLPLLNGGRFMRLLLDNHPELTSRNLQLGLPHKAFKGVKEPMDACYAMTWVASVFGLDLRSQRTVIEMVAAAAAGVPKEKNIYLLWLAVLCAMRHRHPEAFEALAVGRKDMNNFTETWGKVAVADTDKVIVVPSTQGGGERELKLRDVAWRYYQIHYQDLKDVRDKSDHNTYDYPRSVEIPMTHEMPNSYFPDQPYPPSICMYFKLVRTAGHLGAL